MAVLFGSLGSTAFTSQVGQRIEAATDPSLPADDWTLILEICDIIKETDEGPKDAIKALRKRLTNHKHYKSILYTLTLTEACVKNCGPRFHKQIASKEFMNDLTKVLVRKGQSAGAPQVVQDKILSLIQSWSDAFRNAPDLQHIKITYENLKEHGFEFPAQDLDTLSPIFTPDRSELAGPPVETPTQTNGTRSRVSNQPSVIHQANPRQAVAGPVNQTPEKMAKLRSELDIVEGNIRVLSEMLSELHPGKENIDDYTLLVELNKTCREMQRRLVQLIGRIANEEVTGVLLRVNDELNNVFIRYDRYEKNRQAVTGEVQPPQTVQKTNSPSPVESRPSALIDFGDLTTSSPPATQTVEDAEFDMFAQSRSSTFADSRNSGSTYDANLESVPNENSIADVMSAKGPYSQPITDTRTTPDQPKTVEDDIEDVEEWLKTTDLAQLEADDHAAREAAMKENTPKHTVQTSDTANSMSSSEFDRFLADRATIGSQSLQPSQPARQMTNVVASERVNDEMFGL